VVGLQSGNVTVTLPGGQVVPLAGLASVPIGSVVDARNGKLTLDSTVRGKRQRATISAGIFRIRQARRRQAATDLVLVSAAGAETRCHAKAAKGVVRSLTAEAKGVFRTVGGASTATARNGAWTTTDRCDGTLTHVTRGTVSVVGKGLKRPATLRAGRSLLVRARLFALRRHA
jgi:hypothetical protein